MLDFFKAVPRKRKVKLNDKKGIIYHNPPFVKKCLFYAGSYLLLASAGYLLYLYWPLGKALISYNNIRNDTIILPYVEEQMRQNVVKNDDFYINIPNIGASAKVIEDIDPYRKEEYLKILENNQVALANTSQVPGLGKGSTSYIFAHSTQQGLSLIRNNAVFYLLGELKNDNVVFINYHGEIFRYRIYDRKVISANDIEFLDYRDDQKEVLILQTCWPIGTDWKRLLVFGERI